MEDSFSEALAESLNGPLTDVLADPTTGSDVMAFLIAVGLGLGMALIYVPLRLFLTISARSRRLKLLQRIRRLREELAQLFAAGDTTVVYATTEPGEALLLGGYSGGSKSQSPGGGYGDDMIQHASLLGEKNVKSRS